MTVRRIVDLLLDRHGRYHISGQQNIPATGPVLFISNHLSNADAFCLQMAFGREVIFMAGVKLQTTLFTRMMLELVDKIAIRPGAPDKDAIKSALGALKAGRRIHIFPEGGRSRTGALIQGKPGALLIAKMAGVPIVPIGIMGTDKLMPIKESDLEGEKLHHAEVTIRVGAPFHLKDVPLAPEGHEDPKQWLTDQMMLRIAALLDPPYQGVYADRTGESGEKK